MEERIRKSHLTVPEVAAELEMTPDGVYKLIRRGKLKAVRLSERKTLVPRPALDSYRRRLNGEQPDLTRPTSELSVAELREHFEGETGVSPEQWVEDWKRDRIEDSAENMQLLVLALGLRPEQSGSRRGRAQPEPRRRPKRVKARS